MTTNLNPLAGRRILLTREPEDNAAWSLALRECGAIPVDLPCITCEPLPAEQCLSQLESALKNADWLLFGSKRGVRAISVLGGRPLVKGLRIGVVGQVTAEFARNELGRVDLVGPEASATSLGVSLAQKIRSEDGGRKPWKVIFAGADRSTGDLEKALEIPGVVFRKIVIYRTHPVKLCGTKKSLSSLGVDLVFLASPSAVEGLLAQVEVPPDVALISIGPSTSAAIERAGLTVAGEARSRSLEGLMEAIS